MTLYGGLDPRLLLLLPSFSPFDMLKTILVFQRMQDEIVNNPNLLSLGILAFFDGSVVDSEGRSSGTTWR